VGPYIFLKHNIKKGRNIKRIMKLTPEELNKIMYEKFGLSDVVGGPFKSIEMIINELPVRNMKKGEQCVIYLEKQDEKYHAVIYKKMGCCKK